MLYFELHWWKTSYGFFYSLIKFSFLITDIMLLIAIEMRDFFWFYLVSGSWVALAKLFISAHRWYITHLKSLHYTVIELFIFHVIDRQSSFLYTRYVPRRRGNVFTSVFAGWFYCEQCVESVSDVIWTLVVICYSANKKTCFGCIVLEPIFTRMRRLLGVWLI